MSVCRYDCLCMSLSLCVSVTENACNFGYLCMSSAFFVFYVHHCMCVCVCICLLLCVCLSVFKSV